MIRLLVAILASHFIVVHDTKETWMELFTKKYYYWSLLYSMVIAFILIESVYRVTRHLNSHFSGFTLSNERLKAQFYKGFISIGFLAFVLAAVLFWLNGLNILDSNYFEKLYASILLFIFTVNVIYMLFYHYGPMPKTRYQVLRLDPPPYNEKSNIPALIYYEKRLCVLVDFNGDKSVLSNTIEGTMGMFDTENYFQINRKVIVHRAAIISVKPLGTRSLKVELSIDVILPDNVSLIVSKRKITIFKQWLSQNG